MSLTQLCPGDSATLKSDELDSALSRWLSSVLDTDSDELDSALSKWLSSVLDSSVQGSNKLDPVLSKWLSRVLDSDQLYLALSNWLSEALESDRAWYSSVLDSDLWPSGVQNSRQFDQNNHGPLRITKWKILILILQLWRPRELCISSLKIYLQNYIYTVQYCKVGWNKISTQPECTTLCFCRRYVQ